METLYAVPRLWRNHLGHSRICARVPCMCTYWTITVMGTYWVIALNLARGVFEASNLSACRHPALRRDFLIQCPYCVSLDRLCHPLLCVMPEHDQPVRCRTHACHRSLSRRRAHPRYWQIRPTDRLLE